MMDNMSESTNSIREQHPETLQWTIEQAVINLATNETQLQNYLEFRRGGSLFLEFEPFISCFRFVANITGALQDITPTDPVVSKVMDYVAPADPGIWHTGEVEKAESRAREGLLLAREYRQYLASKGIISISR